MTEFDIEGARKAGYTETEIADHLSQLSKFDAKTARASGYSDEEIIQHIASKSIKPASTRKTSATEDLKIGLAGAGKTLDVLGNLFVRAPIQAAIQGEQVLPGIVDSVNQRAKDMDQWANPEQKEQGIGGKLISAVPQLVTGLMSAPETAKRFYEAGESPTRSAVAGVIDAGAQAVGLAIPGAGGPLARRVVGGALSNVAQDAASKKALQALATKESLAKAYEPTLEDAAVAGLSGGLLGTVGSIPITKRKQKVKPDTSKLAKAQELKAVRDPVHTPSAGELGRENAAPIDVEFMNKRRAEAEQMDMGPPKPADYEATQLNQAYLDEAAQRRLQDPQGPNIDPALLKERQDAVSNKDFLDEFHGQVDELGQRQAQETAQQSIEQRQLDLEREVRNAKTKQEVEQIFARQEATPQAELPIDQSLSAGQYSKGTGVGPQRKQIDSGLMGLPQPAQEAIRQLDPAFALGQNSPGTGKSVQRKTATDSGLMGTKATPSNPFGSIAGTPRSKQRGAIDFEEVLNAFGAAKNKIKESWQKIPGHEDTDFSPRFQDPEQIKQELLANVDSLDDNAVRGQAFKSGSSQMAIFSKNPVVKAASDFMQTGFKIADKNILDYVKPVEHAFQKMAWTNRKELMELADLFKEEMFNRSTFHKEDLLAAGYTPKQLELYEKMRSMYHNAWSEQNRVLKDNGYPELSEHEYYTASRWDGDWASHVYDTDGNLVWVVKDRTKKGVNRALDYLEANGIPVDRKKSTVDYTRMNRDVPANMPAAYSAMLKHITEGNPLAQKAREVMDAKMMAEAHRTLGQSRHFENKSNMRGFVGDRPWMDPFEDAKDMFSQQFQYAKNAFQWSSFNDAASKVKGIIDDPEIAGKAPESTAAARQIINHYLGSSDRNLFAKVENAVAEGVGGSVQNARDIVGMSKTLWILQKMGTNTGQLIQNFFQPVNTIPFHTMLSEDGFKHNPVKTLLASTSDTVNALAEHYGSKAKVPLKAVVTPIGRKALKYAEQNGILDLTSFDEHTNINSPKAQVAIQKTLGAFQILSDKTSKFSAFLSYVHHLKQSGKYTNDMELMRDAEHYMQASMVDPRMQERPFVIQDSGLVGNVGSTLQSYMMNYFNQLASFTHRAYAEKKPAALLQFLGVSGAMAGIGGTTAVNGLTAMYDQYREWVAENDPTVYDELPDAKKWLVDLDDGSFLGQSMKYGVPSALTGKVLPTNADLSAKFEAQVSSIPGIGPIGDVASQVGGLAGAVASGSTDKMKSAVYKVAPSGVAQGYLDSESGWFQDPVTGKYAPPSSMDFKKGYFRDDSDKLLRKLGLVSTKESKEKESIYLQGRDEKNDTIVNRNLTKLAVKDFMNGKQESKAMQKLFTRNPDASLALDKGIEQYANEHNFSAQQLAWLKARKDKAIERNLKYAR